MVEVMISLIMVTLILLCVMGMFEAMGVATVSSTATEYAGADANEAMQHIISDAREAEEIGLPDDNDTAFVPFNGYALTNFETTYEGNNVDTGIELIAPAGGTSPTVYNASGASDTIPIYDRTTTGNPLYIYRSDSNGTPDPSAGTCLWLYGTDSGISVNQALITSVSTAPNAIEFARPILQGTVQTYDIEIKLISGYYSPTYGSNTNESTNGKLVTALTGKCVLLRDQYTGANPQASPTSTTNSSGPHWSPG